MQYRDATGDENLKKLKVNPNADVISNKNSKPMKRKTPLTSSLVHCGLPMYFICFSVSFLWAI